MIANCKRCGQLFNKVVRDLCPTCIAEQQEDEGIGRLDEKCTNI